MTIDLHIVFHRLIPNFKFTGCFYNDSWEWTDERPQPSKEECDAEWAVYLNEISIVSNNKNALVEYKNTLNQGIDIDGIRYFCDDNATTDLAKIIGLLHVGFTEMIALITYDGSIVKMTAQKFKETAKIIGEHYYSVKQIYWDKLQINI